MMRSLRAGGQGPMELARALGVAKFRYSLGIIKADEGHPIEA